MDSTAMRVWSAVLTVLLMIIILVNMVFTFRGLINGSLLYVSSKPTLMAREGKHGAINGPLERQR